MKTQKWIAYRRYYDPDRTEDIGTITTSLDAPHEIAWAKAAHRYIGKPYITLGWSLHVRKEVSHE